MPDFPKMPEIDLTGMAGLTHSSAASMQRMVDGLARSQFEKSAGGMAESVFDHIRAFEAAIDADHEVGVRLVTFGQALTVHVDAVGYTQPQIIWFSGTLEDGSPIRLLQHMSQLSFLLMRLPRMDKEKPRRPIGFHHPQD